MFYEAGIAIAIMLLLSLVILAFVPSIVFFIYLKSIERSPLEERGEEAIPTYPLT